MTNDVNNIAPLKAPRFATIFVAVVILLMPWLEAQALGLGEVSVASAINEPLDADIQLLNLDGLEEAEIIVSVGTAADYNLAGVRYNFFHAELEFVPDFSNPARPRVIVSTDQPVTEPYLNFVVQVRWPSGRILREYTILLDLPVFSGERATSAPATPISQSAPAPAQTPPPQTNQAVNVTPSASAGAPATPAGSYRVQFGDTLWEIAQRVANETGITHAQAMLALRDLNPEAFYNGNMNRIMSGSLLRIPTPTQVTVRDPEQARAQVASELGLGDTTPIQSTTPAAVANSADGGGQFRLAAAEGEASGSAALVGENTNLAQMEMENVVLEEELDAANLENTELRDRLAQLEEQIAVLERLVEVENAGLAQTQSLESAQQQPVTSVPAATQPSLSDRLMGWIPWIGIGLIGALIAVYLVTKRRAAASDADLDIADDIEEEYADEDDEVEVDDLNAATDDFDADATVVLGSAPDDFDLPQRAEQSDDEDVFALGDADSGSALLEDDDTDFDDLDAFFSDIDETSNKSETDDFDDSALIQDDDPEIVLSASEDMGAEPDDEIETGLTADADESDGLDFSIDEEIEASEPAQVGDPARTELDEETNSLDFNLDEEADEESVAAGAANNETAFAAVSRDDNALDFDMDDSSMETEESASVAEVGEDSDDGDAMDFGVALDEERNRVADFADDSDDDFSISLDEMDEDAEPGSAFATTIQDEEAETLLSQGDDSDEMDDSIFADLEDHDLDDLLGPEGDDDMAGAFAEPEEFNTRSAEADSEASGELSSEEMSAAIDEDEDLSSLTALLDSGTLDLKDDADDQLDNDLAFNLDDADDELDEAGAPSFDLSDSDAELEVECATKLELAEAYIDMGDEAGAKTLLKEVVNDGSADQQARAQDLLDKIS